MSPVVQKPGTGSAASTAALNEGESRTPKLREFNVADAGEVTEILGSCLDVPEWVAEVASGRPYPDLGSLRAAGAAASARISWEQVAGALDRHPRIGEKKPAVAGTGTESAWSSAEQGGVRAGQEQALADGNAAYEKRFGYIFLICAAGLTGDQILANLNDRLAADPDTERTMVIGELRKIAALRLAKAVA